MRLVINAAGRVQVEIGDLVVRHALVLGRRSHVIAEHKLQIFLVAGGDGQLDALKGHVVYAVVNVLWIAYLHPVRAGAKLGDILVFLELILRHVPFTHAPKLFADLFAAENSEQQLAAEGYEPAVVFGNDLRQEQRIEHRPEILPLAGKAAVGADVERENVENQAVRDVDIRLVSLHHRVVRVGHGGENIAGEHLAVGAQKPESAVGILLLPQLAEPLIFGARQQQVDIVVPRNEAAVAQSADQAAADKVKGDVIVLAKLLEKPQHVKLRELQLPEPFRGERDRLRFHKNLISCRKADRQRPSAPAGVSYKSRACSAR